MLERRIVREVELAFEWVSAGDELIVFLHGVGADRCSWVPQIAFFSQMGYSVAAIDMRGSGLSQARDASGLAVPISVADFAADVHALILDLGFEDAHWVGNSMGGVIIMEAFRQAHSVIKTAVLCNTFAKHPQASALLPRPAAALKTKSLAEFAAERIPFAHRADIAPEMLERSVEAMASKDVETYLLSWRETWSKDYRTILPGISIPTLVITGSLDQITPPTLGEEIARLLPHSRYNMIVGANHLSNLDQPEEFNRIVLEFLRST